MKHRLGHFSHSLFVLLLGPFWASAQGPMMHQPKDSLDAMTQMWHALPAAEVGQVGLAAGSLDASEIPGSMQRLSSKMLAKMSYANPMKTLHALAGLNLVEEDGFGLRPNVGMRGSGAERSSRITLMEDGVLMAPAPYAAPAAYHFPTMARMESVEVRKGGSQIAFGPQTTGGALNLVSRSIPTESVAGRVRFETGSFGMQQSHAFVGGTSGHWGYSLEWMELGSDGFKILDNGGPTGFEKSDRVAKLQWQSSDQKHRFRWKGASSSEQSHETYLGLVEDDYREQPFRRYAASANDVMTARHRHNILGHVFAPTKHLECITEAYATSFARNWYKLDRMVDSTGAVVDLSQALTSSEDGEALLWLKGAATPEGAGLEMKANNRTYGSRGVQHRGRWALGANRQHRMTFGLRWHEDFMDRFEWRDRYAMGQDGLLLLARGDSGSASNRLESANALAGHVQAAFHWGQWTATPGLRHERMTLTRQEFGEDLQRTDAPSERMNEVVAWLPGLGLHRDILPGSWSAFAGIHRGFVPPGSSPDAEAEFSVNMELGSRWNAPSFSGQVTLFFSDHNNLLGSDAMASGGTGSGDLFNGGSSVARGAECEAVCDLLEITGWDVFFVPSTYHMPLRMSYTFTQAYFTQAFESDFNAWGAVEEGDLLPYLAPHQWSVAWSFEAPKWSLDAQARGMSAMRTVAGQGELTPSQSTDAMRVLDATFHWQAEEHISCFAGVSNVFDATYVVSRRPYGIRPGMPRALRLGATVTF